MHLVHGRFLYREREIKHQAVRQGDGIGLRAVVKAVQALGKEATKITTERAKDAPAKAKATAKNTAKKAKAPFVFLSAERGVTDWYMGVASPLSAKNMTEAE